LLSSIIYTINLPVVRPRSCRVIYYFDTPALGRRHQSFSRVISLCYCVVCAVRLQFKIFWQGYIKKNKKNLRFPRRVYRRSYRCLLPTESPTDLHTSRGARMSDTCPSTQIPMELPMSNTNGITDGFTYILKRTHVWHVSICTNTDEFSNGSKSLVGFSNFFWCAFQLISDEITDRI